MSSESKDPKKQTPRPKAPEGGVDRVEEIARLDQRINERTNNNNNSSSSSSFPPPANASMSRVEQLLLEKRRNSANSLGSAWGQPGAFPVRDVDDERSRLDRRMNGLEDRIAAPPSPSAASSMRELEAKISAKVSSGSGQLSSTRSLDGSISLSSKVSMSSVSHPSLNEMENSIADKVRREAQQASPSEAAQEQLQALERLMATKNDQAQLARDRSLQNKFSDCDPLSTRDVHRTKSSDSRSSRNTSSWDNQQGFIGSCGDSFDNSERDHGVERASRSIAVAVAVPVEEDREPIPKAVEYDPDAKQPIVRNRRFRLYSILALFLLVLIAVGIGVGINVSKSDDYDPTKEFAHRDNLGIQEVVEGTVGKEVLEDVSSPFSKALRWIMYHDPMELVPEAPNFMQRYILAYVYYATSVEKPWVSCNPPADDEADSCLWDKIKHPDNLDSRVQVPSFRWLSGVPECFWAGVSCDAFNQTRSVGLWGSNTTGSFPVGVVHLPYLQSVDLIWGSLSGPLPKEIAQMKHLTYLRLQHNAFTGSVPQSRSLQLLDVGANRLSGSISDTIQSLREIKQLYLNKNMITGTIPTSVGRLSGLSYFNLGSNLLQGTIPSEIGNVGKALARLWLHSNNLSGTIPSELGMAQYLQKIYVSNNGRLSGEIPKSVQPQLTTFDGYNCNMSGNFANTAFTSNMQRLLIHNNNFTGQLPSNLGAIMPQIQKLWISGNQFTGSIPDSICNAEAAPTKWWELVADCAPSAESGMAEIVCPDGCCTTCCNPSGKSCRLMK